MLIYIYIYLHMYYICTLLALALEQLRRGFEYVCKYIYII